MLSYLLLGLLLGLLVGGGGLYALLSSGGRNVLAKARAAAEAERDTLLRGAESQRREIELSAKQEAMTLRGAVEGDRRAFEDERKGHRREADDREAKLDRREDSLDRKADTLNHKERNGPPTANRPPPPARRSWPTRSANWRKRCRSPSGSSRRSAA